MQLAILVRESQELFWLDPEMYPTFFQVRSISRFIWGSEPGSSVCLTEI